MEFYFLRGKITQEKGFLKVFKAFFVLINLLVSSSLRRINKRQHQGK